MKSYYHKYYMFILVGIVLIALLCVLYVSTLAPRKGQSNKAVDTSPSTNEMALEKCLGKKISEVLLILNISKADQRWISEPPGTLRGMRYRSGNVTVELYISENDPLFRQFNEAFEWDNNAFVNCHVGGIVYQEGELHIEIGPDIPWQFRLPK